MADSTRRCRPPIADPWRLTDIKFSPDSSFNFFPLITFRTRATNQVRRTEIVRSEDNLHDFMHEKKVFKTGWLWMYGALIA